MTEFLTSRELTAAEIDSVVGGASDPGGGPLNGALGPKFDGIFNAAVGAAPTVVGGVTTGANSIITAVDNAVKS